MTSTLAQYEVAREMFRGAGFGRVDEALHPESPISPDPWAALSLTVELPLTWAVSAAERLTRIAIESGSHLSLFVDQDAGFARWTLMVFGPPEAIPGDDCGRCLADEPLELEP